MSTAEIHITDAAAHKIYTLVQEEENPSLHLRVYINGGGCSGFQYGFAFEEQPEADDTLIEKSLSALVSQENMVSANDDVGGGGEGGDEGSKVTGGVKLLIDPMSFQYLVGAEIDYKSDVSGEQFIIRNPNAKTTCGCGSSFSA
jgi:iron-sulfur cluster insertion protein